MFHKTKQDLLELGQNKNLWFIILLGSLAGAYFTYIQVLDNQRLGILLIVIPLIIGVVFTRDAAKLLFIILVFSLTFSARFRFGTEFHSGGAEGAIAPLDFPLIGLLFLWLVTVSIQKRPLRFRLSILDIAWLLFILAHIPSLFFAPSKSFVLLEILRLLKMGLLMLVIRYFVRTKKDVNFVITILFIAVIFQGILVISQTLFRTSFGLGFLGERDQFWAISRQSVSFGRAGGTLGHSNALANFLEMVIPISFAVVVSMVRGRIRVIAIATLSLGSLGLFLSFSRAGWLALLIGFVFAFILLTWYQPVLRRRLISSFFGFSLALGAFSLIFYERIVQRLTLYNQDSWTFRVRTYQIALDMFKDHPLFGIGANNYMLLAETYLEPMRALVFAKTPVHNIILLISAETGLIGAGAFIFLLIAVWLQAIKVIKSDNHLLSILSIGILAGFIAMMSHAMLDWLFRYDPIFTLFWFMSGLLIAMESIAINNE